MREALAYPRTATAIGVTVLASLGAGMLVAWSQAAVVAIGVAAFAVVWTLASVPALGRVHELVTTMRWWQLLWALLFVSGLVLRARTTETAAEAPLDLAGAYRIGLVAFVAAGLLGVAALHRVDVLGALERGIFSLFLVFNAVNILSALWSVYPAWTVYRSFEFAVDASLAAVIAAHLHQAGELRRLFDWMWLLYGFILFTVVAGVVIAPDRAIRGLGTLGFSVTGVFPVFPRNGIGHISAVLLTVAVARLATSATVNRRFYSGLVVASIAGLLVAQTRSAIAAALIAVPLVLAASRKIAWSLALPIALVAVVLSTSLAAPVTDYLRRSQTEQQIETLTGRRTYWESAKDALAEQPLTGYGAFAGGRFVVASQFAPTLSSTHAAWPELLIGTSVWGVLPIALLLALCWWHVGRAALGGLPRASPEWALALEALGVLAIVTFRSVFSVSLIWHPPLEFLLLVVYAEWLRRRRAELARERVR